MAEIPWLVGCEVALAHLATASAPSPVAFFGAARGILCSGFEGPGAVP